MAAVNGPKRELKIWYQYDYDDVAYRIRGSLKIIIHDLGRLFTTDLMSLMNSSFGSYFKKTPTATMLVF